MDDETLVVNLFLLIRVCLVGGIFLFLPRISRKGLVFGTYVGEKIADGEEARGIMQSWTRGCLIFMASALSIGWGISFCGWPMTGNLTGTVVLLLSAPVLYVRMFHRARGLAPPRSEQQGVVSAAPLKANEKGVDLVAIPAVAICIVTSLASAAYAAAIYSGIPDRFPTLYSLLGGSEAMADKSILAIFYVPGLSLVLSGGFAMFALLIGGAKRSVRGGSGGDSEDAQRAFRAVMAQTYSGMALTSCLILTLLSVQFLQVAQGQREALGVGLFIAALSMIIFALWSLVRILRRAGQGGALLEQGSEEAPLTGGLADNSHWFGGVVYFDKRDPSYLVESRFGYGYTLNLGNWKALLISTVFSVLMIGLVVLGFAGAIT